MSRQGQRTLAGLPLSWRSGVSKIFDAYRRKSGDQADLAIEIGTAGDQALFRSPEASQKDEFNQLANRVLGMRPDGRGAVLAFAATSPGEGSSFVSYNTAVYLATVYRQRVAWVDANFLSPQGQLAGADGPSLASLLQDPSGVERIQAAGNLVVVPAGGNLAQNRGLFADRNCRTLLDSLAARFDFVILDLPPVLRTSDTALVAAAADGLLLVVMQRFLKREVIAHGVEKLEAKAVNVLGAVINRRTYDLPKVIYDRL